MFDAIKIGVKVALIAVVTSAIIALFSTIQIPAIDTTAFSQALGSGLAVIYHWIPVSSVIFPICIWILGFWLAYWVFEITMIAVRWVIKVNE